VFPAVPGSGFERLLSFDDVDRIVSTMSLRTPMFRLVQAGRQIPEREYTRTGRTGSRTVSGIADPVRILALFREGATVVLQGLHRYWEPVAMLVRELEIELGHPCQVNAYVTPPGAQGLALHSDPHDVFVLQTFGAKRWELHAAPGEAQRGPIDVTLTPGDAVYMPRGTPHAASTQEALSGHLTVGVHVTPWRDVMTGLWKRLEADGSLDDPMPAGWLRDRSAFADALRGRIRDLSAAFDQVDPAEVAETRAETFLSTRAPLLRGALADELALASIDDGTVVERRSGAVCEVSTRGGELTVLLGDRRLVMPAWLEPALRDIAVRDRFSVGDLVGPVADANARVVLVRRLVREGLLRLVR
jgi:quercetin dioxygenase-like cupin family protein